MKELDSTNDLTCIRLRTKKNEILIAPDKGNVILKNIDRTDKIMSEYYSITGYKDEFHVTASQIRHEYEHSRIA